MIYKLKLKNADKYALVSDQAYELITNNSYFKVIGFLENLREHASGYPVFGKNFPLINGGYKNETIYLHKYIAEKFVPKPESLKKLFVCFKNSNPLDCRIENLEWITMPELRRQMKKNKSITGFRGVTKTKGKFRAILYDGKLRYDLGLYKTPEEAALAYNEKSIELFGKTKSLNKFSKKSSAVLQES
jgi:hypothetical protein